MKLQVTLELMDFIEQQVLPRYAAFGESHGLRHVNRVIRNALELARLTGADADMVYTIAAYHDLGMSGPRAIHHITGGRILANDARLRKWFSPDKIRIMKEAVEDHRASGSRRIGIWSLTRYSAGLCFMDWKMNQERLRNNNGSVSIVISMKSILPVDIFVCGLPTHPMRRN